MLKLKPALITGGLITMIIAAVVFSYTRLQSANSVLTAQLESAQSRIANLQAESARLAQDIEQMEVINQQLLNERNRLAAIEIRHQATTERLTTELKSAHRAVNELRLSNHDDVKDWANTRIPNDALRLLYNTGATDTDSDNDNAGIYYATGVHAVAVYRARF